jgi:hypothetical protein
MPKFSGTKRRPLRTNLTAPVATTHGRIRTFEGGEAFARDPESELFMLAVTNLVGEDTFYETAQQRDNRFVALVHAATLQDPDWTARFLPWLRTVGNLRTASIVGAAEFAKARYDAKVPDDSHTRGERGLVRRVVDGVLQRADGPGELVAYWHSKYGRNIPTPVKRGLADAILRLYNEASLLKYDSPERAVRFGDVIALVHAGDPKNAGGGQELSEWKKALFKHALDRRHGRGREIDPLLGVLRNRAQLMATPVDRRRALLAEWAMPTAVLRDAGMTWEALAGWLQGPMDKLAWEKMIPAMRFEALLKNLRNFDQAGVSDDVARDVGAVLSSATQVAKAGLFPMKILSAHRAVSSVRWSWPIEQALNHSLANIPALPGRTLILVDTSSSMRSPFSKDGTLMRWDAAAIFGIALGRRCHAVDVVSFSSARYYASDPAGARTIQFPMTSGESLLRSIDSWKNDGYFLGGGTDTAGAIRKHYRKHDRVVIITDEQASRDHREVSQEVPANVPLYTWNLAGYEHGHSPSGAANRHTFGGLTDQAFTMIPLLEANQNADWPF